VNFGASVGQGVGVGGFLGLEEPNLFGQGKRGRLQWQFGRNINDFNISYSDPSLGGSRVSGTVEANNSRVRYTVADLGRITNRGLSVQFGFPLPRSRYSRLFLSGALDWEQYSGASAVVSRSNLIYQCTSCLRTMLGISFLRDTRVDLPFPTGGSMHQVSMNFNGPFGSGTAQFQRLDLEGRWYAPVARLGGGPTVGGVRLVLALAAKSGFIFGDPGPFFRQMYSMGGTQFGIPLRGYDEFAITPAGYNPVASISGVSRLAFGRSFFSMTGEFGVRISQQIYVAGFYDAGNVWSSAAAFNPTRLFRGAGLGASMITPLGPLGLDYAYGFDKTDLAGRPTPGWKLHFRIGNFF
jgi:outer membrane protein insertion porin family